MTEFNEGELSPLADLLENPNTQEFINCYNSNTGYEQGRSVIDLTPGRLEVFEKLYEYVENYIQGKLQEVGESDRFSENCARVSLLNIIQVPALRKNEEVTSEAPENFLEDIYNRYQTIEYYFLDENNPYKEQSRERLYEQAVKFYEQHTGDNIFNTSTFIYSTYSRAIHGSGGVGYPKRYIALDKPLSVMAFGGGADYGSGFLGTEIRSMLYKFLKNNNNLSDIFLNFDIGKTIFPDPSLHIRMNFLHTESVLALSKLGLGEIVRDPRGLVVAWKSFIDENPPPGFNKEIINTIRKNIILSLVLLIDNNGIDISSDSKGRMVLFNHFIIDSNNLSGLVNNRLDSEAKTQLIDLLKDHSKWKIVNEVSEKSAHYDECKDQSPGPTRDSYPFHFPGAIIGSGK